jgi:hypothetical protein
MPVFDARHEIHSGCLQKGKDIIIASEAINIFATEFLSDLGDRLFTTTLKIRSAYSFAGLRI